MTTFHGNVTVGKRFATFTFYAMHESETLLNSFLVNTALVNVISCGVKQYAVNIFADWTRGSYSYTAAILAKDSRIFFKVADISIFDFVFLFAVVVTLIIIAINGSGRIRYNDIIEE